MTRQTTQRYEAYAGVLKAMAHPSRLLIIDALAAREHCVCELAALVGANMPTVSKHVALLKQAGIVGVRKQGTRSYCTLKCPCVMQFMKCITAVVRARAKEHMALVA